MAEFVTGLLAQIEFPRWKKYFGFFVSPAEVSTLMITMEDKTLGGCGNDFAMDDITFCECVKAMHRYSDGTHIGYKTRGKTVSSCDQPGTQKNSR